MQRFKKRRFVVLALLVVGAISAVGGYAFWTQSGAGTGTGTTGTTSAITVKQTSTITGLFPGGPAQNLSGNFDNPNTSPIQVATVSATVTSTSAGASCGPGNYVITGSPKTVNASVPAGTGVGAWSGMTIAMLETGINQDACKGATVNIAYTAS